MECSFSGIFLDEERACVCMDWLGFLVLAWLFAVSIIVKQIGHAHGRQRQISDMQYISAPREDIIFKDRSSDGPAMATAKCCEAGLSAVIGKAPAI